MRDRQEQVVLEWWWGLRVAAVGWDPGRWEEPLAGVWRACRAVK